MKTSFLCLTIILMSFTFSESIASPLGTSKIDTKVTDTSNSDAGKLGIKAIGKAETKKVIDDSNSFRKGSCAAAYAGIWFEFTYKDCLKEVASGDLEAKYILGLMNFLGWGIEKNIPKGLYLWQQAAESGRYDIFYSLGHIYSGGIYFDKDYEKGYAYYAVSAATGNKKAIENLKKFENFFLNDKELIKRSKKLADTYIHEMLPRRFHNK